jgi:hypothetical protein
MGFSDGPIIVTNGLVLSLDAADRNSYSGSGTNWFSLAAVPPLSSSLQNTPTFSTDNGGIFSFNGTNQYADYGNIFSFTNTQTITYNTWIKWGATGANKTIFGNEPLTSTNPSGLGLRQRATNNQYFVSQAAGNSPTISYTPVVATVTNWHMVSITTNGTLATLYINGNAVASASFSLTINSTVAFNIGRNTVSVSEYWSGSISNFQLYNRALSATEILQNYNSQKSRFGL